MKAVQTATVSDLNWKQELYTFLRQERATPHATTNMSPSEALNNRKIHTVLPEVPSAPFTDLCATDAAREAKIKAHGDKHLKTRSSKLKAGDKVLVRQNKKNALLTPFDPSPYTVTWRKFNSVVAKRENETIRRNISFFKIVYKKPVKVTLKLILMTIINQVHKIWIFQSRIRSKISSVMIAHEDKNKNKNLSVHLRDYILT